MHSEPNSPAPNINIEAIMQDIRQQILEQRHGGNSPIGVRGDSLPSEFYEHLYEAGLLHSDLRVKQHVTPISIPLVGPLLVWLRGKIHNLVLFYVNQVAEKQEKVNEHLLQAIDLLAQEVEKQRQE